MTGQQKVERICNLQDHLILDEKEKKTGSLIRKTGFKNHQKEQKSSEKDYIHTKTAFMDKEKCQSKQMTCQNPFKREKDTEERRKTIKKLLRAL